jgi:hypothetical protein
MINQRIFKNFLIITIIFSSIFVLSVPWFVQSDILGLKKEIIETLIILFFLILIYSASFFYFKEFRKLKAYQGNLEERLQETFKYIGSINLQIDEIKKAFSNFKKYPTNKKDMDEVFNYFSEKILSMINADWVYLKIINLENLNTLKIYKKYRGGQKNNIPNLENKDILNNNFLDKLTIIKSDQENLSIKACCILPIKLKNSEERFFISSIINQLELMFLVFSSFNYNKNKK